MRTELPVTIVEDVVPRLLDYCDSNRLQSNQLQKFTLVADQNTYPALGEAVDKALSEHGLDINTVVLTGDEVIADEHYLIQVLLQADREDRTYLAVGSGTITDIVRFVSHRTKASFISLPTAPSVDGFSSVGAPLVVGGLKQTVYCHPPVTIYADLNTLCAAPPPMIAAGFGDILGKYTSLSDWKLGAVLWDEPYSEAIAQRGWAALRDCMDHADEIGRASPAGIRSLMGALVESGLCMVDFGASHPASGGEHYLSHYWEMKLLQENKPAVLHGAKVGVGCVLVANFYAKVRQLTREQVEELAATATMPDREQTVQRIRAAYGPIADEIVAEQTPYLDMSEDEYELFKQRVIENWAEVQDIAQHVPAPQELAELLRKAGGPVDAGALGFDEEEVSMALTCGHFVRDRFTVVKLFWLLGIEAEEA